MLAAPGRIWRKRGMTRDLYSGALRESHWVRLYSRHPWRSPFGPASLFGRAPACQVAGMTSKGLLSRRVHLPAGSNKKRPAQGGPLLSGGGGGNRTPVRRRSAPGATCLVRRSISSRSSTPDKAHRGTSGFCFSHQSTSGNRRRSRDDDPTSTSTCTSGFGAYALSGESVDVVVGV